MKKNYLIPKSFLFILAALVSLTSCNQASEPQKKDSELQIDYALYSPSVKDSFYISLQLPLEYASASDKDYPVVYLTDGNFFGPMLGPILHQYEKGGLLPPLILASIHYKSFEAMDSLRVRDYLYPASIPSDEMRAVGGGQRFYQFITDELIPKIDSSYRTLSDKRTLLGHSFGGYFSLLALSEQIKNSRHDFNGFVAASPTLWYNNFYMKQLDSLSKSIPSADSLHLFLSVGGDEEPQWFVKPVNDLAKSLAAPTPKNLKTDVEIYSHLDHMNAGLVAFVKGLQRIYNPNP
ncbi:alpha/beta hydrolase [Sphingobacterium hungaricum]